MQTRRGKCPEISQFYKEEMSKMLREESNGVTMRVTRSATRQKEAKAKSIGSMPIQQPSVQHARTLPLQQFPGTELTQQAQSWSMLQFPGTQQAHTWSMLQFPGTQQAQTLPVQQSNGTQQGQPLQPRQLVATQQAQTLSIQQSS